MNRQLEVPGEQLIDLQFPIEGVNEERPYSRQRRGTTFDACNVRTIDPKTGRTRGASRSGMGKFCANPLVQLNSPIQDINQLETTSFPAKNDLAGFVYAQGSGNGFGIAATIAGTSTFSGIGAVSGYQFANSCCDDTSNFYAATVKTTDGTVKVYKVDTTGAVVWTQTGLTVATGNLRHIAGMVVVGQYLLICLVTHAVAYTPGNPDCRIVRLLISTGTIESNPWRIASANLNLYFSSSAVNCIAKIGNIVAVDCANPNNLCDLLFFDATTAATAGQGILGYCAYGGTTTHNRAKVVSDGTTFFYVIASTDTNILRKIGIVGLNGAATWATASVGTPNGLCFDQVSGQLIVAAAASPSIRKINLTTGDIASTPSLGATVWTDIDSDGHGNFVAWKNSVASGDVIGLASNLGSQWGPSTLANTVHNGASVNKGKDANVAGFEHSSRVVRLIAVSNGEIKRFDADGPVTLSGGVALSAASRIIHSAQLGLNLFFVDGVRYVYYKNAPDAVLAWTASSGTIPFDDPIPSGARGIEPWRGRLIIFDFQQNPQRFYMCKQGDAFDWNFSPATTTTIMAIASTTPGFNYPGERINCVIPYTDDMAIFGDASRIWMLKGDLADGGVFDIVSPEMGMVRGRPWARDQQGQLYFMASDGRIHKMTPGSMPVKVSQQIDRRLLNIDLRNVVVRMTWDTQEHGLHVWMTDITGDVSKHFFYEERLNAWFPIKYANEKHSPFAVHTIRGDDPESRRVLVGGQDGYIRVLGSDFEDDDGKPISSFVWIVLMTRDLDFLTLRDMHARLAEESNDVTWECYVGKTVEAAKASAKAASGTWQAGFNPVSAVWQSGHEVLVKLSSTKPWALERIAAVFTPLGSVLRRI